MVTTTAVLTRACSVLPPHVQWTVSSSHPTRCRCTASSEARRLRECTDQSARPGAVLFRRLGARLLIGEMLRTPSRVPVDAWTHIVWRCMSGKEAMK
eukprot:2202415-Prymnesium_polylepis.1